MVLLHGVYLIPERGFGAKYIPFYDINSFRGNTIKTEKAYRYIVGFKTIAGEKRKHFVSLETCFFFFGIGLFYHSTKKNYYYYPCGYKLFSSTYFCSKEIGFGVSPSTRKKKSKAFYSSNWQIFTAFKQRDKKNGLYSSIKFTEVSFPGILCIML